MFSSPPKLIWRAFYNSKIERIIVVLMNESQQKKIFSTQNINYEHFLNASLNFFSLL
jgi:hypothetical protein